MYRRRSPGKGPSLRSKGELYIKIQEEKGALVIAIIEARNLLLSEKKQPSCYAKLYVLPDENKSTKQKTKVVSGRTTLVFKEQFSYDLPKGERSLYRLYVSLWRRDRTSRNELVGSMSFAFKEILDRKTKQIEGWYHLLPDGEGRCNSVSVEESPLATENLTDVSVDSWLPTKMIALNRSPFGYGFSLIGSCPVTIATVEDNTPAKTAGIQVGDRILQVGDKSVAGARKEEVFLMIRACEVSLQLLVQRPAAPSPRNSPDLRKVEAPLSGGDTLKRKKSLTPSLGSLGSVGSFGSEVATPHTPFRGYISWKEISPLEQKRQEAILELVRWEKKYVYNLHFGIERYAKPLRMHEGNDSQHHVIFDNIDELLRLSSSILKLLKGRRKPFHLREAQHPFYILALGDIYKAKINDLSRAYDIYHLGRSQAEMELSLRRLQPDFLVFLEEPPLNEGQPTIDEFVGLPLEYLGKVRSLLRKIMANTPTYHPDQQSLLNCLETLDDSNWIKTELEQEKALKKVNGIEKSLAFLPGVKQFKLAVPGRTLLHSGDLLKFVGKKRKPRKVHALLFTDILVFTRQENSLFIITDPPVDMTSVMVQDYNSVEPTEFCLTVVERSGGEKLATASWKASHQMQAPTLEEKETWRRLIDERAKGVSSIRRKSNLKNFRTMPVVSSTTPEEDLKMWEREQQLRLFHKAPHLYSSRGNKSRARPLSISSAESTHSASSPETSSPTRDRKTKSLYRHLSLFDKHSFKSKMQKRRHSFATADALPYSMSASRGPSLSVSPESIEAWKASFEGLVKDQDGLDVFRRFLESEFSDENILFWMACEEMKQMKRQDLEHKAKQIYADYIASDAPMEVNLDAETKKTVIPFLDNPSHTMFERAQKAIFYLMERDSYKRFLESEEFRSAEEAAGTKL